MKMKLYAIDNTNSYFFDPSTNSRMELFEEGVSGFRSGQEIWNPEKIKRKYGGEIVLLDDNNMEVGTVDYPYYNLLRKAGYIVYKNFDHERCDFDQGFDLRYKLRNQIINTITDILKNSKIDFNLNAHISGESGKWYTSSSNFDYIISVENIDKIVEKNRKRKDNNLKYYPYDKRMDKYGTLYLSIFSKRKERNDKSQYDEPNEFVALLMKSLGPDYHFNPADIKAKILYSE